VITQVDTHGLRNAPSPPQWPATRPSAAPAATAAPAPPGTRAPARARPPRQGVQPCALRQQPPYVGLCRGTHLSTSSATTTQRNGNCSVGVQVCSLKPAHLPADTASTDLLRRLGPGPCGHRCMIAALRIKLVAGMSCYAHAAACFRSPWECDARGAPRTSPMRRSADGLALGQCLSRSPSRWPPGTAARRRRPCPGPRAPPRTPAGAPRLAMDFLLLLRRTACHYCAGQEAEPSVQIWWAAACTLGHARRDGGNRSTGAPVRSRPLRAACW